MRFDEVELEAVPLGIEDEAPSRAVASSDGAAAGKRLAGAADRPLALRRARRSRSRRSSPQPRDWTHLAALAGFVVVLSYYYFVGTWMLWGKTIGGAIFDVRVVPEPKARCRCATPRCAGRRCTCRSPRRPRVRCWRALPSRLSLPDRLSHTRCVAA